MDKLDLDMDDILLLEDIPLLKDIVTEASDSYPSDCLLNPDYQEPQLAKSEEVINDRKENPFLPYEHLAKLALEREKFTQSIEAFTENLKHKQTDRVPTQTSHKSYKNDAIVQAITSKVLAQLKPIIEERVTTELKLYFEDTKDSN